MKETKDEKEPLIEREKIEEVEEKSEEFQQKLNQQETTTNKPITINLKTLFIIIAIVILVVVILLYFFAKQIKKLPKTDLSYTSEVIEVEPIEEFEEEKAIELLKQYLEDKSLALSNPQALLEKYSYATNSEFSSFKKTADEKYIRTTLLYENLRRDMTKYITKDFFLKEFATIYKNENGALLISVTQSPKTTYLITRHEMLSQTSSNTKKTINVWYKTTTGDTTSEEKNMNVEFTKQNGNWIISNIK